jgi:hypothetical protein
LDAFQGIPQPPPPAPPPYFAKQLMMLIPVPGQTQGQTATGLGGLASVSPGPVAPPSALAVNDSFTPPPAANPLQNGPPATMLNPNPVSQGATGLGDLAPSSASPASQGQNTPPVSGGIPDAADGSMAWSSDNGKTIYIFRPNDMSLEKRTGGTPSWRDNSPGNLGMSKQAEIGHFDVFPAGQEPVRRAIYDSEQTGWDSLYRHVFEQGPSGETLEHMIRQRYATGTGDNPSGYLSFVSNNSRLSPDTVLNSLNAQQRIDILNAIKLRENWTAGSQSGSQFLTANGWK